MSINTPNIALETPNSGLSPATFATSRVGNIFGLLGTLAGPLMALAIAGMGAKMIVTGKPPKMLS